MLLEKFFFLLIFSESLLLDSSISSNRLPICSSIDKHFCFVISCGNEARAHATALSLFRVQLHSNMFLSSFSLLPLQHSTVVSATCERSVGCCLGHARNLCVWRVQTRWTILHNFFHHQSRISLLASFFVLLSFLFLV